MGRKRINPEEKRKSFRIYIPIELYEKLQEKEIKNKSKFFNWLLELHFGILEK